MRRPPAPRCWRLPSLYGDVEVLAARAPSLPALPGITRALAELAALAGSALGRAEVAIDLADLRGYQYESGAMFALYVPGLPNAVARGGRYDHVGEAFGRARPATGFSLDLRELARLLPTAERKHAIRAPWGNAPALREKIAALRAAGEIVIQSHAGSRQRTRRVRVRPRARPRRRQLDSQKLRLSDVKYC